MAGPDPNRRTKNIRRLSDTWPKPIEETTAQPIAGHDAGFGRITVVGSTTISRGRREHDRPAPAHPETQDAKQTPPPRYQRRWLVECFFAWLQWKRRLLVRWQYCASSFLCFVQLAKTFHQPV
jgi:hypothetical protein